MNFATFTSDYAKQIFSTILIQSIGQNKLKFLLFLSLSKLPGKLSLNRVHRDDFPDLKPFKYPNFATKHYIIKKTHLNILKITLHRSHEDKLYKNVSKNKRNNN